MLCEKKGIPFVDDGREDEEEEPVVVVKKEEPAVEQSKQDEASRKFSLSVLANSLLSPLDPQPRPLLLPLRFHLRLPPPLHSRQCPLRPPLRSRSSRRPLLSRLRSCQRPHKRPRHRKAKQRDQCCRTVLQIRRRARLTGRSSPTRSLPLRLRTSK